jgi:3-oxoacyl-(acyl-carrier-protein) synthase
MAVAITGVGMVSSLGNDPAEVVDRIIRGERCTLHSLFCGKSDSPIFVDHRCATLPEINGTAPSFLASSTCPLHAPVSDFDAEKYFPENKTLRLMSRDAQMAVIAARLAIKDAGLLPDELYPSEKIALYGATGLSGMQTGEIARLVCDAAAADGSLDLENFGRVALKRIRPVLSFKILANMPICFVSIFENLRGPNAVYTPWEGNGGQAIIAGIEAIESGEVPCAVVGGCDVKTHALSMVSLHQLGILKSWQQHGVGCIPSEGAAFLVLENLQKSRLRGAKIYGIIRDYSMASTNNGIPLADTFASVLHKLNSETPKIVVAAGDGDPLISQAERQAFEQTKLSSTNTIYPKSHLGNLFAAAAAIQIAMAAMLASRQDTSESIHVNCFGYGSEHAAFVLEAA